jgi:hypothetical protein
MWRKNVTFNSLVVILGSIVYCAQEAECGIRFYGHNNIGVQRNQLVYRPYLENSIGPTSWLFYFEFFIFYVPSQVANCHIQREMMFIAICTVFGAASKCIYKVDYTAF